MIQIAGVANEEYLARGNAVLNNDALVGQQHRKLIGDGSNVANRRRDAGLDVQRPGLQDIQMILLIEGPFDVLGAFKVSFDDQGRLGQFPDLSIGQ